MLEKEFGCLYESQNPVINYHTAVQVDAEYGRKCVVTIAEF